MSIEELKGILHDTETFRPPVGKDVSVNAAELHCNSWGEAVLNAVLTVAKRASTHALCLFIWKYLHLVSMLIADQKYRF